MTFICLAVVVCFVGFPFITQDDGNNKNVCVRRAEAIVKRGTISTPDQLWLLVTKTRYSCFTLITWQALVSCWVYGVDRWMWAIGRLVSYPFLVFAGIVTPRMLSTIRWSRTNWSAFINPPFKKYICGICCTRHLIDSPTVYSFSICILHTNTSLNKLFPTKLQRYYKHIAAANLIINLCRNENA